MVGLLVGGLIFDLWIDVEYSRIHDVFDRQWTVMGSVSLGISEVRWRLKESCDFWGVNTMCDYPIQRGECFFHRLQEFEFLHKYPQAPILCLL